MTQIGLEALSGKSIIWAALHIFLGIGTIALTFWDSRYVTMVLGWLFLLMGAFLFLQAVQSKGEGHTAWKVLVAVLYQVFGFYIARHPHPRIDALTLVLTTFFLAEGVIGIAGYLQRRKLAGSGWILFDGVVALVIGMLVGRQWLSSSLSVRVIGTLVGISIITTGTIRAMLCLSARHGTRVAP